MSTGKLCLCWLAAICACRPTPDHARVPSVKPQATQQPAQAAPLFETTLSTLSDSPEPPGLFLGSILKVGELELILDRVETRRVLDADAAVGARVALIDEFRRDVLASSAPNGTRHPALPAWAEPASAQTPIRIDRAHMYLFVRIRNRDTRPRDFPFSTGEDSRAGGGRCSISLGGSSLRAVLEPDPQLLLTGCDTCIAALAAKEIAPGATRAAVLVVETDLQTARERNRVATVDCGDAGEKHLLLRSPLEHRSMVATERVIVPLLSALHARDAAALSKLRDRQTAGGAFQTAAVARWISEYAELERTLGRHALSVDHAFTYEKAKDWLTVRVDATSPCELDAESYGQCLRAGQLSNAVASIDVHVRKQPTGLVLQGIELRSSDDYSRERKADLNMAARYGLGCWRTPMRCGGEVVDCVEGGRSLSGLIDAQSREVCRSGFEPPASTGDSSASSTCPGLALVAQCNQPSLRADSFDHAQRFAELLAPGCGSPWNLVRRCFETWHKNADLEHPTRDLVKRLQAIPAECGTLPWGLRWPIESMADRHLPDTVAWLDDEDTRRIEWLEMVYYEGSSVPWATLRIYSEPWARVSIDDNRLVGVTPLVYPGVRVKPGKHFVTLETADGTIVVKTVELGTGDYLVYVRLGPLQGS
jgi:hypothetical protein